MCRTTHTTGYDDVATLQAGLESRWAAYASTRGLPTLLDEAYTLTYTSTGEYATLRVEGKRYAATFIGPRLPVHGDGEELEATLERDYAALLRETIPLLDPYTASEQDRFLARTLHELED